MWLLFKCLVLISILYPSQTSGSSPKKTPASRLAAKAAAAAVSKTTTAVPETPVRDTKQSPKKTVTPKKSEDKGVVKESPSEKTPKTPKSDEPDEVPPSWRRKNQVIAVSWQGMVPELLAPNHSLR